MKHALYAFFVLAFAAVVLADRWSFPNKLITTEHAFGDTKIVVEVDGTKDQGHPPHTLSVYAGDQLLARYRNVGFETVYASKDNKFFAGLSNFGIPGTAFIVFDAKGNLLREEKHRFLPHALYTSQSVTLLRVWYDAKNPEVEFNVRDDRLESVFIRGSNGQKYDLLKGDLGFREVPADR